MSVTPESLARNGTEHGEQAALFCEAAIRARQDGRWRLLYAIPNGGKRDKATAARMRAEGVKPGVPDVCLPVARHGFHGLYIELKREFGKWSDVSANQADWIADLKAEGYAVWVCYGWKQAVSCVANYLGDKAI